jgi:glycosyltransferase involved in cell wall biosynthesis
VLLVSTGLTGTITISMAAKPVRVLLFDWISGGHHEPLMARFAEALSESTEVCVAAPDEALAKMGPLPATVIPLGSPRPTIDDSRHFSREKRRVGQLEVRLMRAAALDCAATHVLHVFADGTVRWLLREPPMPARVSLLLFRPRAHYPALYESPLRFQERVAGLALDRGVWRWMSRSDAQIVLTYDEAAASRWAKRYGARAQWLTEPAVRETSGKDAGDHRTGYILAGSLSARKGIELLAAAAEVRRWAVPVRLMGAVDPGYTASFREAAARIRSSGAEVEVCDSWQSNAEYLAHLGRACCSIIAYPRHIGMSRVLLESAAVGTPIVAHNWGLLGHLVKSFGLGIATDCRDPVAFRSALDRFAEPHDRLQYAQALAAFAATYSEASFRERLRAVWQYV